MMHDRPSDPEYCQGIYDAAQRVVEHYSKKDHHVINNIGEFLITLNWRVEELKRALEGKP